MDLGIGEERVKCIERVTWKLTLPCKIDSQWEFAAWLRKLNQPRGVGWGGRIKREGIYVHLWLIHVED